MRASLGWLLGLTILIALTFWLRPGTTKDPEFAPEGGCRIVFQVTAPSQEVSLKVGTAVLQRLSSTQAPGQNKYEVHSHGDEMYVAVPGGTDLNEITKLVLTRVDLRLQTDQGWGPAESGWMERAAVTTGIDDEWALWLSLSDSGQANLSKQDESIVGLFCGPGRPIASLKIDARLVTRKKELTFLTLGTRGTGKQRPDGGYGPPTRLENVANCIDHPLPANATLTKLRVEPGKACPKTDNPS